MGYSAFISYRRSDGAKTANWLRNALQAFRPPAALREKYPDRISVFLDTAYERGTHDFYEKTIQPALLDSKHLIVIATPDAATRGGRIGDDWIVREITDFTDGPNSTNLIIVRAAGQFDGPLPGNLGETYPNAQIIDLRGVTDWNLLHFGRGAFFDNEKLKIVSALLEIPLEDMPLLRREEERKHQSRIGLIGGLGLAAVGLSVGVSVYALQAQIRGQRALDQSLSSVDSIVVRATGNKWDAADYLRDPDPVVRNACNISSQLAVEARLERDRIAMAICDLEYVMGIPDGPDTSERQRQFLKEEYVRLTEFGQALHAQTTGISPASFEQLERVGTSANLIYDLLVNRNRQEAVHGTEALRSEFDLAYRLAEEFRDIAGKLTQANEDDLAGNAVRIAGRWTELASLNYFNRNVAGSASEAGTLDPENHLLQALVDEESRMADLGQRGLSDEVLQSFRENLFLSLFAGHSRIEDRLERHRLLYAAAAVLERLPEDSRQTYAARLLLRQGLAAIEAAPKDDYSAYEAVLTTTEANAGLVEQDPSIRDTYLEFQNDVVEKMHRILDGMRRQADELGEAGKYAEAFALLSGAMEKRQELYRRSGNTSDWSKIFMLMGEARLSGYEAGMGKPREAEERRRKVYGSLVEGNFQTDGLLSGQADELRMVWNTLVDEHHAHLDRLRERAIEAAERNATGEAVDLMKWLCEDDREWDLLKDSPDDFDRVYGLEAAFLLAFYQDRAGQPGDARVNRFRSIREFLPLLKGNAMNGRDRERGEKIWKTARQWIEENGIDLAGLQPIAQLASLKE